MISRIWIVLLLLVGAACQQQAQPTDIPTLPPATEEADSLQPSDVESSDINSEAITGQSPDSNANSLGGPTETYTDSQAGFAFDYPEDWYVQGDAGTPVSLTSFEPEENGSGGIDPAQTKIDFVPQDAGTDIEVLAENQRQMITEQDGEILQDANYELADGTQAIRIEYTTSDEQLQVLLFTTVGDTPLLVAGFGNLVAFDEIVSTLRADSEDE
ncbi:MAG: hypothetical protein K8L99_05105 [Anaerolineae bacterium]|nr:hypothetical protein [Anaerolineae bacterium]